MFDFSNKVAIITGAAKGIGAEIARQLSKAGATVYTIDLEAPASFIGDLSKQIDLEAFAEFVLTRHDRIDFLIHNAAPLMRGLEEASYDDFTYALQVGVTAPFYLTKLFSQHLNTNASIILLSSTRDRMSQSQTESYTAAKGGIAALTHGLAASLAGKARVNSISPGWIDTQGSHLTPQDHLQHPVGRVGRVEDIAHLACFLCSDQASFITGENITVDGGMTKLMIYHGDQDWSYHPNHLD